MKNKPKIISRPQKKTKSVFKKTPAVKAVLSGKKKKPEEKTGRNKIVTPDKASLRKIKRELRETKQRLRLLSEAAEEGIAVHDNGVIIDANDALARLFGYELSEIIGMKAKRFASPESWKVSEKHISHKSVKPYEGVGIRKDGSTFIFSLVGKPYQYKGRKLKLAVFHNITEHKKAEDELRREEHRFKAIAELSSDIFVFVNREGIVTYENPAVEKLLGLKPAERIGINVFDRIHPDDLKVTIDTFNTFTENISSEDINGPILQLRLRHQNGSWRTFETSASKLFHDNIIEAVIINLRDITERKQSDDALRESESRFRAQYNGIPIPTFTWQKQGDEFILTEFNDSAKTIMGSREKSFLGTQASELYRSRQDILQTLQICFDEKRIIRIESLSEHFMPGKHVVITFVFVPPDLVMVHMEDITERKTFQEALQKNEANFRLLAENAPDAIHIRTGPNFVYVNNAALKLFGANSPDQLIGKPVLERIHPDYRENVRERMRILNEKKIAAPMMDERYIKLDGTVIDVEVNAVPFRYDNIDSSLVFARDITERKRAEEEINKYREDLEELVRERTIKLEASNKELEAFSFSASHDLRAPVRTIDGFSRALLEDYKDKLDVQGKDYLTRIRLATSRMTELIDDLLQLSRDLAYGNEH